MRFQYDMYPAPTDPIVQPVYAPRNYYEYDQPAELVRSERRYRTTDPDAEFHLMQRLVTLRNLIEQEQQMHATRERRMRQSGGRPVRQNNFELLENQSSDPQIVNSMSELFDMANADSEAGSPEPEVSFFPPFVYNYPKYNYPLPYSQQAPSHASYTPHITPVVTPSGPPSAAYAPHFVHNAPSPRPPPPAYAPHIAPIAPAHHHNYHQQLPQPQPAPASPCAKNLLVGCQPHVQQVPCSSSYENQAEPYPFQPYNVQQSAPLQSGLSPAHNLNAPPARKIEPISIPSTTEAPTTNSAQSDVPNANKPDKIVVAQLAPPTDNKEVAEHSENEPLTTTTAKAVTETKPVDAGAIKVGQEHERSREFSTIRKDFMQRIHAKRTRELDAQNAHPAKVVPMEQPYANRQVPAAPSVRDHLSHSEYNNLMW